MWFFNKKKHPSSLSKQLLIIFTTSVVTSLFLIELLCILFLYFVIQNISSTSTYVLTTQITQNVADSVSYSGVVFQDSIRKIAESVLLPVAQATSDTFRTDQPLSSVSSYFDNTAGIQAAGSVIPPAGQRDAGQAITLLHSTWMISNYTGTDAPTNITTDQQITLDNSAHVDNFFAITYSQNQDVDAVYVGFDDLFFRYYPGTGMIRAFGPYDHTTRGWYLNAKQYTSPDALSRSLYVISDPYKDAAGKGWMVTFSTVVTNSSAGNVIGAAGVDLLIGTLQSNLEQVSNGSQVSLYLSNGVAVANPNWDLVAWDANPTTTNRLFRYNDSSNPTISNALWNQIVSTTGNTTESLVYEDPLTGASYLVIWQHFSLPDGATSEGSFFVSVATFPMSEINIPVALVNSEMSSIFKIYTGISIAIFLIVLFVVVGAVILLAKATTRPLDRLIKESDKMNKNYGSSKALSEGVNTEYQQNTTGIRNRFATVDETEELRKSFYEMVATIRKKMPTPQIPNKLHNYTEDKQYPEFDSIKDTNAVDGMTEFFRIRYPSAATSANNSRS